MIKILVACGYALAFILIPLLVVWMFTQFEKEESNINTEKEQAEIKPLKVNSETFILVIIMVLGISFIFIIVSHLFLKRLVLSVVFIAIYIVICAYMIIKNIVTIVFIPRKREFSKSDITDFLVTYTFVLYVGVVVLKLKDNLLLKIPSICRNMVIVVMLYIAFYFIILFAVGGIYIILYLKRKRISKLKNKVYGKKMKEFNDKVYSWYQKGEKYSGLRCYRAWKEMKEWCPFRIVLTIILLFFVDTIVVMYTFMKSFLRVIVGKIILSIFEILKILDRLVRNMWNKYQNMEFMYMIAQMAGLLSYCIVFVFVQFKYGKDDESLKNIYEFIGTIILIPYFWSKIMSVRKKNKEE